MGGFRGLMTPHNREIVDCGPFCEVTFFWIFPNNLLGDCFDSLAIDVLFSDHPKCLHLVFIYLSGLMFLSEIFDS